MPGNWKKKTFVQTIFESSIIIIIKNMYIMKNLTDFRKMVETGVDPPLLLTCRPKGFSFSAILVSKWAYI